MATEVLSNPVREWDSVPTMHYERSASVKELALALSKAQGEIANSPKSAANPFFHSKYSDLASVRNAIQLPLSSARIAYFQFPYAAEGGIGVETLLVHGPSGEWVSCCLEIPVIKADAQAVGKAITYARRYSLGAIVGIAPQDDDDDGNSASAGVQKLREQAMTALKEAAAKGTPALEKAWKALAPDARKICQGELEALKNTALNNGES
jgi:hypothetical protein